MASSSTGRMAVPGSTFCYWVKRWRSYRGVTQRRFAELWGVSASLVQKIEANDYSVSQLSFERLEALRTMLGLPSATFYSLIATHPDIPANSTDSEPIAGDQMQVQRLEPDLPPLALPWTLLGDTSLGDMQAAQLTAFALAPEDFAPDRLRYSLRVGTLLIYAPIADKVRSQQEDDVCVSLTHHHGYERRVLLPYSSETPVFLRPFDPQSDEMLELHRDDLEPLGVVVAHWTLVLPR